MRQSATKYRFDFDEVAKLIVADWRFFHIPEIDAKETLINRQSAFVLSDRITDHHGNTWLALYESALYLFGKYGASCISCGDLHNNQCNDLQSPSMRAFCLAFDGYRNSYLIHPARSPLLHCGGADCAQTAGAISYAANTADDWRQAALLVPAMLLARAAKTNKLRWCDVRLIAGEMARQRNGVTI